VDPVGVMYDGAKIDGPASLRAAILKYKDVFVTSFTESLMTYALGRRVEAYDMPALRAIVRSAETQNYSIQAFVAGVARSAAFQMSRSGPVETAQGLPRRSSPDVARAKAGAESK
jgi:hypothetical protein